MLLDLAIFPKLKFEQDSVKPRFLQWKVEKMVYGLYFTTLEEANLFVSALEEAIKKLKTSAGKTSVLKKILLATDQ